MLNDEQGEWLKLLLGEAVSKFQIEIKYTTLRREEPFEKINQCWPRNGYHHLSSSPWVSLLLCPLGIPSNQDR